MGVLSIVWYVGLTIVSENILFDSIAALGLMIAFYYGLTGFACVWYFRHELTRSAKSFFLAGVMPLLGGLMLLGIFVKSCVDLSKPENSTAGDSWLGLGPPVVIGVGFLLLGVVLMIIWRLNGHREFFGRRPERRRRASLEEAGRLGSRAMRAVVITKPGTTTSSRCRSARTRSAGRGRSASRCARRG